MFYKPYLAKCANRNIKAKENYFAGSPEDWFSNSILKNFGFVGISFDFFINWSNLSLARHIWLKRITDISVDENCFGDDYRTKQAIIVCDGKDFVESLCKFCEKYGFILHYMIFKDIVDWSLKQSKIRKVKFDGQAKIIDNNLISINGIRENIKYLSGGPLRIGKKGLIYGTSNLECFLSKTDSPWPGDVDCMIVDSDIEPIAILEYKKHTLNSDISSQSLRNYYPNPDGRKYNRLALLRDHISNTLPILNVYYPTKKEINNFKVEIIVGKVGELRPLKERIFTLPNRNDFQTHQQLLQQILKMI